MKSTAGTTAAKRAAGERAAAAVTEGDTVGLGTGSTAAAAIRALGDRVADGLDVTAVTTSHQSQTLAREVGIPLDSLAATDHLDVAIDGADAVTVDAAGAGAVDASDVDAVDTTGDLPSSPPLIKGGGGAHVREKIVAAAADRYLVVVDDTKLEATLSRPVPVAVLPEAEALVTRRLRELGGEPQLRAAERKDGPVVTDDGNLVVDCAFGEIDDPAELGRRLAAVPGLVEHGLFLDVADELVVGESDGTATVRRVE
jgi:ribose 5-phosphate isomerase A